MSKAQDGHGSSSRWDRRCAKSRARGAPGQWAPGSISPSSANGPRARSNDNSAALFVLAVLSMIAALGVFLREVYFAVRSGMHARQ